MAFSKTFPRQIEGSNYPKWEEIKLTDAEEQGIEEEARRENINLMNRCLDDAKALVVGKSLEGSHTDLISIAISLFEKRASHQVYWKERRAKQKFDSKTTS